MWFNPFFNICLTQNELGNLNSKKLAKYKNNLVFQNVFARYVQIALNRYGIKNIPDTISERVMLQSLLWYGCFFIFYYEGSLLGLPGAIDGTGFNINGDPGGAFVFSANGRFNKKIKLYLPGSIDSKELGKTSGSEFGHEAFGVLIRENAIMYPFIRQVMYFADCVSDSMRTLDVCRQNIKQPFIITAEEQVIPTVKQFFKNRNNNEELIISTGVFDPNKVALLPFETNQSNLQNATELIDWYENKFREICGIENNSQIDKKGENLIEAEVSINDEYTELGLDVTLEYIQQGLDQVNMLFGTNMQVYSKGKEMEQYDDIHGDDTEESESMA